MGLLENYSKKFGLGSITGIDLCEEKSGLVPSRKWKKKVRNEPWYDGDTVNISIGQGYLLITPLQAANIAAWVANSGKLFRPYLVKEIRDTDGKCIWEVKKQETLNVNLKPSTLDLLKNGMENVVSSGTGFAANIQGVRIAGKTGTAENPQGEVHGWFIGYAPVEDPQIALAVFVEHGGMGGVVAAPIAKKIFAAALNKK